MNLKKHVNYTNKQNVEELEKLKKEKRCEPFHFRLFGKIWV